MKRILIRVAIVVFSAVALWRLGCVHAVVVGDGTGPTNFLGARTKVVFRVVDDEGNPVPDAKVGTWFWLPWNDNNCFSGRTDANGCFTVRATSVGEMGWSVERYGYYKSRATDALFTGRYLGGRIKFGRWQPYGAVREVELRRKKEPIPMRVSSQSETIGIPDVNKPFPFDAVEYDWLPPHGKGKIEDFSVSHYHDRGENHSRLEIIFPPHTGYYVVKKNHSEFQSPYYADPQGEYLNRLVLQQKRALVIEQQYDTCDTCFILRLRTKLDNTGKVMSCIYGKIYGPIKFEPSGVFKGGIIGYWQYLNMIPNDTNLEFDVKSNLRKYRDFPGPVRP